jgi:hypothetical protein
VPLSRYIAARKRRYHLAIYTTSANRTPVDLDKPRRNILIVSSVLILAELSGAKVGPAVTTSGVTVTLSNPEIVLPFIWLILLYSVWRFWIMVRTTVGPPFAYKSNRFINRTKIVRSVIAMSGNNLEENRFLQDHPLVVRHFFRREIQFRVHEPVAGTVEEVSLKLKYHRIFFNEIVGDIRYMLTDSYFVENTLPILVGVTPVLIGITKAYIKYCF